jgi:glucokinase
MEAMSSATGIEKEFEEFIKKNPNSPLAKKQLTLNHKLTIADASDLIKSSDQDAVQILSNALKPLVDTIAFLATCLDLEAVLIGGGPSALGQPLIDIIKKMLRPIV